MYMWGASIPITGYRVTSSADTPTRDPKDWTFQGCKHTCTVASDSDWVTLDTRTNQTFGGRLQQNTYSFSNTTAYSQYRLRITANQGAGDVALRELQMFDGGGAVVPLAGVDRTEGGTVTWTGKACSASEVATRAFDNLMSAVAATRWCATAVPSASQPVSIAYTMPARWPGGDDVPAHLRRATFRSATRRRGRCRGATAAATWAATPAGSRWTRAATRHSPAVC